MEKIHDFLGEKIAYSIQGKGRTIVLIHGFLGSKSLWIPLVSRLKSSFRLISIDLPGHGKSNCVGYLHNMEMLADLVAGILSNLKVRKAVIVGHSLGGYVSLAFAEKYPDKIHGMVLINSTANSDSKERLNSRDQLISIVKRDKTKAVKALVPSFFVGDSIRVNRLKKKYLKVANLCSTRGIVASIEGMKIRKEREIVLKFAPYPYLFIAGANDPILNPKVLKKQALLGESGAFLELQDSAHMSFMEEEGKVFKAIKEFAKKAPISN